MSDLSNCQYQYFFGGAVAEVVRCQCRHERKLDVGKSTCTEGAPIILQELSGRPPIYKAELDLQKKQPEKKNPLTCY